VDATVLARHVGLADVPWVENPRFPGTRQRLLQCDLRAGFTVSHGIMPAGLRVGTHRHEGPVHMFTLSGAWEYLEHDFVNVGGSYLYEPPGSVHTLHVLDDGDSEVLSIVHGRVEYIDAHGEVIGVSDAATTLRVYLEACEAAGIPAPTGMLR
jgi:hypothetical protein